MDGSQRVQFLNHSTHTAPQLIRPAGPAHVLSDSSSSLKARDAQNVMSSALSASGKVTVQQAATSEKLESPKARPHGEVNIPLSQKDVEAGELESGSVSRVSDSPAPPAKSPVETSPVATAETGRGKMVNGSSSVEYQIRTCKVEPSHKATEVHAQTTPHPLVSDRGSSASETGAIAAMENSSLPVANGFRKQLMEVSPTSDAPTSDTLDTNIDKTTEGISHVSSNISGSSPQVKDLKCDERTVSDKQVDGATDICSDSENLADDRAPNFNSLLILSRLLFLLNLLRHCLDIMV